MAMRSTPTVASWQDLAMSILGAARADVKDGGCVSLDYGADLGWQCWCHIVRLGLRGGGGRLGLRSGGEKWICGCAVD